MDVYTPTYPALAPSRPDGAADRLLVTGTGYIGPDGFGPSRVGTVLGEDAAVPQPEAFLAAGFDPAALLGRKTARFNHRSTLLAVEACARALRDAGLEVGEHNQDEIGATIGTLCGSVTGSVAFGLDTFAQPLPYNVNPAAFPNLVINTAAGAVAIKHGLRGPNSTVAGGPVAGINALRHASLTLRAGHAEAILVGAAEEYGLYEAWLAAAARPAARLGEAAAVLVLERADAAAAAGRRPIARIAGVLTRAVDPADAADLRRLLADALEAAAVRPRDVRRLYTRATMAPPVDAAAVSAASLVPVRPRLLEMEIGDCYSAHAAVQLVRLANAARREAWDSRQAGVVLAVDPDGLAGVAVLTGAADTDTDLREPQ